MTSSKHLGGPAPSQRVTTPQPCIPGQEGEKGEEGMEVPMYTRSRSPNVGRGRRGWKYPCTPGQLLCVWENYVVLSRIRRGRGGGGITKKRQTSLRQVLELLLLCRGRVCHLFPMLYSTLHSWWCTHSWLVMEVDLSSTMVFTNTFWVDCTSGTGLKVQYLCAYKQCVVRRLLHVLRNTCNTHSWCAKTSLPLAPCCTGHHFPWPLAAQVITSPGPLLHRASLPLAPCCTGHHFPWPLAA